MFDTREELVNALTEAAELEHGLLCQYLFAAVSLKRHPDEGPSWEQLELVRGWEAVILAVARQEMAHLGTVANLLTAIGGVPHFGRPSFPQPARYFPVVSGGKVTYERFTLEPFSARTVRRFVRFEEPEPAAAAARTIAPDPVVYTTVGALYAQISQGIQRLDEAQLFVGPRAAQDTAWGAGVSVRPITGRDSALSAIAAVVAEGEGTPTGGGASHWARFKAIGDELAAEQRRDRSFEPARPVAANPITPRLPDDPRRGTAITHPRARAVAELFNAVYGTTLLVLARYYTFAEAGAPLHDVLQATARQLMSGVVRPLGEVLTGLPVGEGAPGAVAGPGFELYTDLRLPSQRRSAWLTIHERLVQETAECERLSREDGAPPRLAFLADNLSRLARNLAPYLDPQETLDARDALRRLVPVPPRD
jgi:hypothetical protein